MKEAETHIKSLRHLSYKFNEHKCFSGKQARTRPILKMIGKGNILKRWKASFHPSGITDQNKIILFMKHAQGKKQLVCASYQKQAVLV